MTYRRLKYVGGFFIWNLAEVPYNLKETSHSEPSCPINANFPFAVAKRWTSTVSFSAKGKFKYEFESASERRSGRSLLCQGKIAQILIIVFVRKVETKIFR